ncbi:GntR family transcriptional regulator [Ferrimonas gelatinilytica]|uniref:GntR family transcriptional regulator n=1 Tax=Ferrimonas gelatinilytica TaxID=1255257 RepID=A0ABP9S1L0_9GAMM
MSQGSPIIHKTRTQRVVEVLRDRILSGQIPGGTPLRQSNLAEELNVSRIPIREALLQLEAEGLVRFEAHRGATATELSMTQLDELFELRVQIEPGLLARSVPNLTAEQLQCAEAYLQRLESAFDRQDGINQWSELNALFHLSLYAGARRPHTLEIVRALNTNADRYIRLQLVVGGGIPSAKEEHRALLDLCFQGDAQRAADLLHHHILDAAHKAKACVAAHVGHLPHSGSQSTRQKQDNASQTHHQEL